MKSFFGVDKRIRIAGIIGAIVMSIIILTSPTSSPPIPEPNLQESRNDAFEILATNLKKPWAIDFADERIFITEKIGQIRVVQSNILLDEPLAIFRTADIFGCMKKKVGGTSA